MKDPRLLEIEILSQIEAACASPSGFVHRYPRTIRADERFMMDAILHLAFDGAVLLTDAYVSQHTGGIGTGGFVPGKAELESAIRKTVLALMRLASADVNLLITQRGRLRLYRLRDEILNRDRVRDDFGILWAKRHWLPDLEVKLRFRQPTEALSIILLNADYLNEVSTKFGHAGANEVLKGIFEILRDKVHPADAYRLSRDEAGAILPNTDIAGASKVAEDIRTTVESTFQDKRAESGGTPTATLAVGTVAGSVAAEDCFKRVNEYLTEKKNQGGRRNVVLELADKAST